MTDTEIVSLASTGLALATVCVAALQVQVSIKSAARANALPVLSEIFKEWGSEKFNTALRRLLRAAPSQLSRVSFGALPRKLRRDAHTVCYFFDYLGTLVLYNVADPDIIIGVMATRLIQVWVALEPLIMNERDYRRQNYPAGAPRGFLVYFEHLVRLIELRGGDEAAKSAQRRAGILSLSDEVRHCKTGKRKPIIRYISRH